MPDFDPTDVSALSLTRLVYRPSDTEVDEAVAEVAAQNRTYEAKTGKAVKAKDGDQVVIDFIGRIDGEAFEGGSANDAEIVLGAGRFIPGFEEQLVGAAPGAAVTVNVTFPEDYQVDRLKGQPASFEVTVKEVRAPKEAKADDALAVNLGLADLDALRAAIATNIEGEYQQASRFKLKRALLDALDSRHDIPLPPRMVEAEFEGIWQQVKKDEESGELSPEDVGKSEDTLRAEYRKIAERRVRLGLVLAEIGRRENVVVTEQELADAMRAEAMRYGDMAQRMFDMLRESPQAQANMRAPLYEEKVVDLILARATVTDKVVSKEELLKEDELPEGFSEETPPKKTDHAKAPAAKAATAKAKPAKAKSAEAPVEAAPVAKAADKAKSPAKPKAAKAKSKAE